MGLGTSVTPRGGGAGGEGAGGGGGGGGGEEGLCRLLRSTRSSGTLTYADVCCLGILQMLTCRMLMYADVC